MDRPAEERGALAPGPCIDRTRAWIGLAAIVILVALLVPDVVGLSQRHVGISTDGNDYMKILGGQKRHQVVNFIIGAALHDGVGKVTTVYIPTDLKKLSARASDKMIKGVQQAIQLRFLRQLVGGKLVSAQYDPVVPTADRERVERVGRLKSYPRRSTFFGLRQEKSTTGPGCSWRDPTRLEVLIIPAVDAPAGVKLP